MKLEPSKKEFNSYLENLKSSYEIKPRKLEELHRLYEEFVRSNFLEFLPANYSPLLSIGFVSFLSLFIFIIPLPIPEAIINITQWFVIYDFTN